MKRIISLQTLKTDISKKEALLKTLYNHYPDMKEYSETQLAAYFGLQTFEELYQHLQNIEKAHTPDAESIDLKEYTVCRCTDGKGYPKELYENEASAQQAIERTKVKLSVYPCPSGFGWHLTKR